MTDIAVRVENLSKQYRIGARQPGYRTIRETMTDLAAAPLRRLRSLGHPSPEDETIWALKDVTFDVKKGEVVGIIGRNGAGKTTLLRIFSRITEPTEGYAEIKGRVGSLLEVGTGFHPELTGRENIYLNGAILGMKRAEIDRRFDEIVAFSEIEKFLDTPVKRYSSGMYVRLAFSVAAHLEPEILLVDEVLAVGDAAFQKKCLGKMDDVAGEGRTVLFVSHNMGAVRQLCSRVVFLHDGQVVRAGEVESVIDQYLRGISESDSDYPRVSSRFLQAIEFIDQSSSKADSILAGDGGLFRIHYDVGEGRLTDVCVTIALYALMGIKAMTLSTWHAHERPTLEELSGRGHIDCRMEEIPLAPGQYRVNAAFDGYEGSHVFHDGIVNGCQLTVMPSDYLGTSRMKAQGDGFVLVKQQWIAR